MSLTLHLPPPGDFGEHILSCPACWSWQLHYTDLVATLWPGGVKDFQENIEDIIREHVLAECPNPALIHVLAKQAGIA